MNTNTKTKKIDIVLVGAFIAGSLILALCIVVSFLNGHRFPL